MKTEVALVHAPSIYDFRTRDIKLGPISDVIPSTPVFEMYPIGFVSMLSSLIKEGYNARICNVAAMMVSSDKFDPVKYLKDVESDIFGIDLHWLPHVNGALKIARIIKDLHQNSKVLLGGFSATYFAEDIMKNYEYIDFILSGDLQENNIVKLAETMENSHDINNVPNLIHRDGGRIVHNQRGKSSIDDVFLNYGVLMKNALKYHDIKGHLPYASWLENTEAMTVIEHGCSFNCAFCGGSNFAYRNNYNDTSPVYRKPEIIAEEISLVQDILGSPVFITGDINRAGEKFYSSLFREMKNRKIDLPLLTEFFVPPEKHYLDELGRNFPDFTVEISPESSNETIRNKNGRPYDNKSLENFVENSITAGSKKIDVYFTIGLSGQTAEDVNVDLDYSEGLMKRFTNNKEKLYTFISPLTPFIDPGSLIYEHPEDYGFTITARTISDYFNLLENGKIWTDFLNYYTKWMNVEQIAKATYESEIRMIRIRQSLGLLAGQDAEEIVKNITGYMHGDNYISNENRSSHLSYIEKDVEWSYKHKLTKKSFLISLYRSYNDVKKKL
ncbi:MAG: TIGR04190 family B12-binding domain/radical SAM domain protein [Ferroplasma sp.]|uniref:TIGR04190 family B12-binding domain/radical SAM domain protein n=1 Tax=Ferroplasma sp. TaxID=2591003 RepID=UPI002814AF2E|nr:TIGR04190 family B12-binding domain/radical SAM domain protein [Ferroplasma sp.]WMT52143.1 MAG: TIGR04190 family B12-binding domain/radical SAM domain protein [Ferroplasma sp.]